MTEELRSTDLFFSARVPNEPLRAYVGFVLARKLEQEPDALLSRADVLNRAMPTNLDAGAEPIASLSVDKLAQKYAAAHGLDEMSRSSVAHPHFQIK
jgi:hypothetical protein